MDFILPCVYAMLGSLAFALSYQISVKRPEFYASAFGGMLAWGVYLAFSWVQNDVTQYFFASLAVTLYGEVMARLLCAPVTVFLLVGLIPLVPGGGIYYTMEHCIRGDTMMFLETGLHTMGLAGAMALGILLSSAVTRLVCAVVWRSKSKGGGDEFGRKIHSGYSNADDDAKGAGGLSAGQIDDAFESGGRGNAKK